MSRDPPDPDWSSSDDYAELRLCDRRAFAWEWLRRSSNYRGLWAARKKLPQNMLERTGLLAWVDPNLVWSKARPIWSRAIDPKVLRGHLATGDAPADDLLDILSLAPYVSVEIDATDIEHWLLSDGHWAIRIDIHNGTLLGGPALIEYRMRGSLSAKSSMEALKALLALSVKGRLTLSMAPREHRAAQWILELRVADALLAGATQQDMARTLFNGAIAPQRWRHENSSYRLRIQRLVRIARDRLSNPLGGPWFK